MNRLGRPLNLVTSPECHHLTTITRHFHFIPQRSPSSFLTYRRCKTKPSFSLLSLTTAGSRSLPLRPLAAGRRRMDSDASIDDFVAVEAPVADDGPDSPPSEPLNPNLSFVPIERPVSPPVDEGSSALPSVAELDPNSVPIEWEEGFEDAGGRNWSDEGDLGERRELPEEILKNVAVLTCENNEGGTCQVYLVGTAHVSQESCREVQAVISCLKPQVVFLELCPSRIAILTLNDLKIPTMSEMIDMWKKKQNVFGILYSWFLAKVANKLEVLPGSEFRVAFEEAMKYGGKVILGDRPVQITLRRTWGKMPLWHKAKLFYSLLFQAVFLPSTEDLTRMLKEMDDVDMLTLVIQEMSKEFPTLMETLVNERDQYMSSTLLRVASEHSSVVVVVGKGHVHGIKRQWKKPVEMNELLEIPSVSPILSAVKILTTVGVAVAGVAIISGIYMASKKNS